MYNTPVAFQKLRRIFGVLLMILSLATLTWGLRSGDYLLQTTDLAPSDLALSAAGQPTGSVSTSGTNALAPGPRTLALSYPTSLRLGDAGTLRLTVGLPPLEPGSGQTNNNPTSPDIYGSYNLVLQSHLDLPGMAHTPTGEVSQALPPDKPVVFIWYLRPNAPGVFSGKVWLHLRFVPRATAQEKRILLAAQQIDVQVITLMGMSGSQARLFGSLGLVLGGFLALDGVVSWGFEQLVKRKKGQET